MQLLCHSAILLQKLDISTPCIVHFFIIHVNYCFEYNKWKHNFSVSTCLPCCNFSLYPILFIEHIIILFEIYSPLLKFQIGKTLLRISPVSLSTFCITQDKHLPPLSFNVLIQFIAFGSCN